LQAQRLELLRSVGLRHCGRFITLTDGGVLGAFPSAVDALEFAIEFQQAMLDANRDQPEDVRIAYRLGLHIGDLIVDGEDLNGEEVNIAARLEAAALPGGIIVSAALRDLVVEKVAASFEALGPVILENIKWPISAFHVTWAKLV